MARDFNGTTDRIDFANAYNPVSAAFTFSCWADLDSLTGGRYFLCVHNSTDTNVSLIIYNNSIGTGQLGMTLITSGTALQKATTDNFLTTGLQHLLVTWDGSLNHSGITLYRNNVAASVFISTVNGTGTAVAGTGSWSLGGRIFDDLRNLDGDVAACGVWNRALAVHERAALAKGYSPRHFPRGLRFAPDLMRGTRDPISQQDGTPDGTTVTRHPRILYPTQPQVVVPPASGALLRRLQQSGLYVGSPM